MVDCLPLGDSLIIYTETGKFSAQYVGGNDVFRFTRLMGNDGLMQRNCVVQTPMGHVFLTKGYEVMLFDGQSTRSLSKGRLGTLTQASGAFSLDTKNFLTVNLTSREVWVCIVPLLGGSTYPSRVLVWSWEDDTWGIKTPASTTLTAASVGLTNATAGESVYLAESSANKIGYIQSGIDADWGTAFDAMIERKGLDLGEPNRVKNLQRSRWNMDAQAAQTLSVQHGAAMTADAAVTYASAATYTVGTSDFVNSRATGGKYVAVKVTWNGAGGLTEKLRSCDLDVTLGGSR
jgi:hypothetical protein